MALGALPSEILFGIFENLPLLDVLKCEKVCKHWETASLTYLGRIKKLCLHKILYGDTTGLNFKAFNSVLEQILSKCSDLRSLRLARLPRSRTVLRFTAKYELTITALWTMFKYCPKLEVLDLSHHIFPNEVVFEYLTTNLPGTLRHLRLENCRLDVVNEGWVDQHADFSRIDGVLTRMFHRLPNLQNVSFYGSCNGFFQVTSEALRCLPKCLAHLDLSASYAVKLTDLKFCENLPNLRSFFIERSRITQDDLEFLVDSCPKLENLGLCYCHNILDFSSIANLGHLKTLCIDGNRENFFDNALTDICDKCPQIRHLSAENCRLLSDDSLSRLSQLKSLTFLSLSSVVRLTDPGLKMICQNCSNLTELHLKFCKKLTQFGLYWLPNLRNLKTLFVNGIENFDQSVFDNLIESTKLARCEALGCAKVKCAEDGVSLVA